MKRWKLQWEEIYRCTSFIEADTVEDAWEIAFNTDEDDKEFCEIVDMSEFAEEL